MAETSKQSGVTPLLSLAVAAVVIVGGTATFGLASSVGKTRTAAGIAANADALIAKQIAERSKPIADRGQALARLSRQPLARQLLEPASKTDRATADLRWLLRRDIRELKILKDELATVRAGAALLAANQPAAQNSAPTLTNPLPSSALVDDSAIVTSFGVRTRDRLTITSRGVDLAANVGDNVVSPIGGTVVHVGRLGQHDGLILESSNHWVVVSGLVLGSQQRSALGKTIERGAAIGTAASATLHLEVRVVTDSGGLPVQPAFETR